MPLPPQYRCVPACCARSYGCEKKARDQLPAAPDCPVPGSTGGVPGVPMRHQERVFPLMLAINAPDLFSYRACNFKVCVCVMWRCAASRGVACTGAKPCTAACVACSDSWPVAVTDGIPPQRACTIVPAFMPPGPEVQGRHGARGGLQGAGPCQRVHHGGLVLWRSGRQARQTALQRRCVHSSTVARAAGSLAPARSGTCAGSLRGG
jgi:hypothetical protein